MVGHCVVGSLCGSWVIVWWDHCVVVGSLCGGPFCGGSLCGRCPV